MGPKQSKVQRLERRNSGAPRYWEIVVRGCEVEVSWGHIGGKRRKLVRVFGSRIEADIYANKKICNKIRGGYLVCKDPEEIECEKVLREIYGLKESGGFNRGGLKQLVKRWRISKCKSRGEGWEIFYPFIAGESFDPDDAIWAISKFIDAGAGKRGLQTAFIDYYGYDAGDKSERGEKISLKEGFLPKLVKSFNLERQLSISLNLYIFHATMYRPNDVLDGAYINKLLEAGANPNFRSNGYRGGRTYKAYTSSAVEIVGGGFVKGRDDGVMKLLLEHGGDLHDAVSAGADGEYLKGLIGCDHA